MTDTFRTPAQVHHELNEAISLLEWAEVFSRTAGLDQIDAANARLFRKKIDTATSIVQKIEAKLPKPKEVRNAAA